MGLYARTPEKERVKLDEFFKSLMFQKIMDSDFTRNERDMLLVIFRKTIHYDKWEDNLSKNWLIKAIGISENTLKITQTQLINKSLLVIKQSKGGRTKSPSRFNSYSIGSYLIDSVYTKWISIKENYNIPLEYYEDDELNNCDDLEEYQIEEYY